MTKFVLYGIAGVNNQYRVVKYDFVEGAITSVEHIKAHAGMMRMENPTIEHVYIVNAGPEIANDYRKTVKRNSVEGNVIFKVTLEQYGIMII